MTDQQLADLYDAENVWADDDAFFVSFVDQRPGSRVLDLGCGTGRLTLALAAAGHDVIGADPDAGALAAARRKPGAGAVTWIEGTAAQVPGVAVVDTVVMTAHVAQAMSDPATWARTLADVHRLLRPGGRLAFDSRDPAARAWERWTAEGTRGRHVLPGGLTVETWIERAVMAAGVVTATEHRLLPDGAVEAETMHVAFRTEGQLRQDLQAAGFTVADVLGGWHGEPVGSGPGELVVLARR